MSLEQQLVFLFSAIGAVNGFALSSYFLVRGIKGNYADRYLGGLLLMVSIRVIKSVFRHFNPDLFEGFIQFGLGACILIGPFLFLYVHSVVKHKSERIPMDWLHLLVWLTIFLLFSSQYSYYQDRQVWRQFIEFIYKQWLVYIVISGWILWPQILKAIRKKSFVSDNGFWTLNIYWGVALLYLAYDTSRYTSYIVGALTFTLLSYLSLLLWYFNRGQRKSQVNQNRYANSTLSKDDVQSILSALDTCIAEEKPYLDPSLTITKLGRRLHVSSKDLSQVINQCKEVNYSTFIAGLRIQEAADRLANPDFDLWTIAAISHDSGFNSLSSFNASFKKWKGCTAAEFRKQQRVNS